MLTTGEASKLSCVYSAVIKRSDGWWIGWVREVAGVNAQAKTREELLDDLRVALKEAVEMNCRDAEESMAEDYEQVVIQL